MFACTFLQALRCIFTCRFHNDRRCTWNACARKVFSLPFPANAFLPPRETPAWFIHPDNNLSATRPHINKHGPTCTSTQSTFPVPLSQSAGRAARQRKICRNKGQVCHILITPHILLLPRPPREGVDNQEMRIMSLAVTPKSP